ncbi:MAG: toxin-antitoxin system YwqK family antitoxin [Bacteroidota bacterium]
MLDKKEYSNGQKVYELKDDVLTYFYKNGKIKAKGPFINSKMEGKWIFYRETGQLWQEANFRGGEKHGRWIRYDRNDQVEYDETFDKGKTI